MVTRNIFICVMNFGHLMTKQKGCDSCNRFLLKKNSKLPYFEEKRFEITIYGPQVLAFCQNKHPQFMPYHQHSQKWQRIEVSKNKSSNQSSEATCTRGGGGGGMFLFCWGSMVGVELLLFYCVLIKFPMGSQKILQVFNMFPLAPQFITYTLP